ncbi:MAG TPA: M48 family metallopeptidase [Pyrinomonadaceae bacterium]|nr:M48 family metallopeptidase [Pyrinomonadaceae bacterium]
MKRQFYARAVASTLMMWSLVVLPLAAVSQTRVTMPKNKYKVQDDVKLGRDASREVARQFPLLNDNQAERYVESVGERLVAAIPAEFQQPAFDYQFDVVNARDINAFALPGGPMYVNRGMIEAARNEGEMAGVMAHEISHVALRHATAQATKQSSVGNTLGTLGMILGGAILGGQGGAQLGAMGAQVMQTRYSRDYETQADILGSQIMANAGYDPRDLANIFRTIEQQSGGGRAPEWMSTHPNPGNRFENIIREASRLNVSPNARKITPEFRRVQERLRAMPRARTMAEIQRDYERTGGRGGNNGGSGSQDQSPIANGNYSRTVDFPSARTRVYSNSAMSVNIPDNWQDFNTSGQVWFAPEGAYGSEGITHGAMVGAARANSQNLSQATGDYINELLQANSYLRQAARAERATVAGRTGIATVLSGRSSVTGRTEIVTVYTAQLSSGNLFFVATVAPEEEASRYDSVFRNMVSSIQLND